MEIQAAYNLAIDYLAGRGVSLAPDIAARIKSREIKQAPYYQAARNALWAVVYDAVYNFLSGASGNIVSNRNAMSKGVAEAYNDTGEIAYQDGGGKLPMDEETQRLVAGEQAFQLHFVENLFERLKELKKEPDVDPIQEAFVAADRWTYALDGFYNDIKMSALGNKMLTWHLGGTIEHCRDCSRLDGQRHRASWYRRRDFIPRKAGASMECQGYRCDCSLTDDNGMEVSI